MTATLHRLVKCKMKNWWRRAARPLMLSHTFGREGYFSWLFGDQSSLSSVSCYVGKVTMWLFDKLVTSALCSLCLLWIEASFFFSRHVAMGNKSVANKWSPTTVRMADGPVVNMKLTGRHMENTGSYLGGLEGKGVGACRLVTKPISFSPALLRCDHILSYAALRL